MLYNFFFGLGKPFLVLTIIGLGLQLDGDDDDDDDDDDDVVVNAFSCTTP